MGNDVVARSVPHKYVVLPSADQLTGQIDRGPGKKVRPVC